MINNLDIGIIRLHFANTGVTVFRLALQAALVPCQQNSAKPKRFHLTGNVMIIRSNNQIPNVGLDHTAV